MPMLFRAICVFGVGDLPMMSTRKEIFANKFHYDFERAAYECMEERHFAKTLQQTKHGLNFDTTFYEQLDAVQSHVV